MLNYCSISRPVINDRFTRDSKVHDFVSYSLTESSGSPMGLRAVSAIPETAFLHSVARLAQN